MNAKWIIAALIAASSSSVYAVGTGAVCTGLANPTDMVTIDEGTVGEDFVVRSFKMACSKNVFLSWDQDETAAWVAAVSKKGSTVYGGTTEGGGGSICLQKLTDEEQKAIAQTTADTNLTKAQTREACGST